VSPVTLVFMSQSFGMYLITMLSLKQIDINWLFCVIDKFMIMMLIRPALQLFNGRI